MHSAGARSTRSIQESLAHDPVGRGDNPDVAAIQFRSWDLDETRAFLKPRYGDHSRIHHGRDQFSFAFRAMASSRVVVGVTQLSSRQTLRAAVQAPTLFLSRTSGATYNVGRKVFESEPRKAMLLAPGHEYSLVHANRSDSLGLRVDGDLLHEQIATRLTGRSRHWLLQSIEIPMDERRQAGLRDIHARMTAASTHGDAWGAYGDVAAFEREVASLIAGFVIEQSGAKPAVAGTLGRVDRVERWVDAHISEEISLDQLCKLAGVGWRPLQKAFLAVKGQSPLEFVASRRLAAVHARLMQAADDVMVSRVAMDLGFSHLGRFAANYRRIYGESPSDTVRAAKRK